MLKALGYTLTGEIGEQCFFVCLGPGGTGKSTLLNLMDLILGENFAEPADLAIFDKNSKKFASAVSYETSTYKDKHYVFASEPEGGAALTFSEAVIKKLSGSERLKARMIYEVPVGFYPKMKLWFSMNHRPLMDTSDTGFLRRIIIIPFKHVVQTINEKESMEYARRLFEEEGPGILNRLFGGLANWCAEGLEKDQLPRAIAYETGEYRTKTRTIEKFFERTSLGDAEQWYRIGYMYAAYVLWAKELNARPQDRKGFAAELRSRKCERRRGDNSQEKGSGFIWYGIRLLEPYRHEAIAAAMNQPEPDEDGNA